MGVRDLSVYIISNRQAPRHEELGVLTCMKLNINNNNEVKLEDKIWNKNAQRTKVEQSIGIQINQKVLTRSFSLTKHSGLQDKHYHKVEYQNLTTKLS